MTARFNEAEKDRLNKLTPGARKVKLGNFLSEVGKSGTYPFAGLHTVPLAENGTTSTVISVESVTVTTPVFASIHTGTAVITKVTSGAGTITVISTGNFATGNILSYVAFIESVE